MASAENREREPAKRLAVELDGETRDILSELVHGERHTTYLQDSTGVKRQKLHRRLDRLEEDGVIDTEKKKPQSGGQARRHARLTDHGEDLVDDGLLESITDVNQNVSTIQEQLDELQKDVRKELDRRPSEYEAKEIAEREAGGVRNDLEEEIHQLRQDITHLENDTEEARQLAEEADTDVADAVSTLETRVKRLEETAARVERRAETFEDRLAALESGRSPETRDRQIDALLDLVGRLAIQADAIDNRLEETETNARRAKRDADEKIEELEEFQEHFERKLDWYDRQVEQARDSAFDTCNSLRSKLKEIEADAEEWQEFWRSIEDGQEHFEQMEADIEELKEWREEQESSGLFF